MEGTDNFWGNRDIHWDRLNFILQQLTKQIETNTMRDLEIKGYVIDNILYIPHFNWKINLITKELKKVDISEIYKAFKENHSTINIPYEYTFIINHFLETEKEYQKVVEVLNNLVTISQ